MLPNGPQPSDSASGNAPALVEVRGLVKHYRIEEETIEVLRGVDLTIGAGEMLAVTGASGVGKSTLLHVIGTLDAPTAGAVRFDGLDVFRFGASKLAAFRNRHIGIVYQFHHLLPDFTALENVLMPGLIARERHGPLVKRAEEVLDQVGLSHRLKHKPSELSGGEQQRVAVARAMIMRPRLLLADELTGNLDERTAQGIHDLLFELNALHNTALLVVTHNVGLAARMPRRVILRDGRVEMDVRRDFPTPASLAAAPQAASGEA